MIKQTATGLNSRSEVNPFDENGFLPLITAPMYSVVDDTNYQVFLDNKIQVCMPRNKTVPITDAEYFQNSPDNYWNYVFESVSLSEFIEHWIENKHSVCLNSRICIDTANGNMPALHDAIRKAKELHGDNLIIMAGNVSSVEAFMELAKTGCDYIRVGIGGGGGCNTTSNTGVGQEDLEKLIYFCNSVRNETSDKIPLWYHYSSTWSTEDRENINKVKIVADGISSYIKLCQDKYGFNDNGYAAINKLLFAGADLVMIGKLFAQCVESAGEKQYYTPTSNPNYFETKTKAQFEDWCLAHEIDHKSFKPSAIKYSGMSTQEEQLKYKPTDDERVLISPSEGSVQWIPVRWSLTEWLNGSTNQDESPYLMGWINSIRSAMSYTGKKILR